MSPSPSRAAELDRAWSARLRLPPGGAARRLARAVSHSGDALVWVAAGAGLWLAGHTDAARAVALAVAGVAVAVVAAKAAVRRGRPAGWRAPAAAAVDRHSFPSGHAARAAALAAAAAPLSPWPLAWALAVGLARVGIGAHYLADVAAGWGLGLLIGAALRLPAR